MKSKKRKLISIGNNKNGTTPYFGIHKLRKLLKSLRGVEKRRLQHIQLIKEKRKAVRELKIAQQKREMEEKELSRWMLFLFKF